MYDTVAIPNNASIGEIGLNWYDTVKVHNNANIQEIQAAIQKAYEIAE